MNILGAMTKICIALLYIKDQNTKRDIKNLL